MQYRVIYILFLQKTTTLYTICNEQSRKYPLNSAKSLLLKICHFCKKTINRLFSMHLLRKFFAMQSQFRYRFFAFPVHLLPAYQQIHLQYMVPILIPLMQRQADKILDHKLYRQKSNDGFTH